MDSNSLSVFPSTSFHSSSPFALRPITITAAVDGLEKILSSENSNVPPSWTNMFLSRRCCLNFKNEGEIEATVVAAAFDPLKTTNPSEVGFPCASAPRAAFM